MLIDNKCKWYYNNNIILCDCLSKNQPYTANIKFTVQFTKCTCNCYLVDFKFIYHKYYLRRIDYLMAKCEGLVSLRLPTDNAIAYIQKLYMEISFNSHFSIFMYLILMCLYAHNFLVGRHTKMF